MRDKATERILIKELLSELGTIATYWIEQYENKSEHCDYWYDMADKEMKKRDAVQQENERLQQRNAKLESLFIEVLDHHQPFDLYKKLLSAVKRENDQ